MDAFQSPAQFLRAIYISKKDLRPKYSARAFARDLGMSQALLSLILNEKRPLTVTQASRIAALLDLPQEKWQELLELTWRSLPNGSRVSRRLALSRQQQSQRKTIKDTSTVAFRTVQEDYFQLVAQWYTLAILDLSTTSDFQSDPAWIAKRLGIHVEQVKDAIHRLLRCGLFKRDFNGKLTKTYIKISFPTKKSKAAFRNYHRQLMQKAVDQLELDSEQDFKKRSISSTTMAVHPDRIDEARARIASFHAEMSEFMTEGSCSEVYQLNVQLFPLTKWRSSHCEEKDSSMSVG